MGEYMNNDQRTMIAIIAIIAAIGLVGAVTVPSFVVPQQAYAAPFPPCHSFGPGHSNDACR
jgi:hypothetical protein